MELMTYVAETLSAEKHAQLEEAMRFTRLAKQDAARPAKKRAFALKLMNVEITVRTVHRAANS
ncbi:hypothetical protein MO973_04730 [Paenibacillus sp. TRM 82003]|nr:hypothetical protein [Paenibacillus sp. TRM 82003]